MKVKLFTHSDLDGLGCIVVAKNCFTDVDYTICEYNNINGKVMDFLESDKPTDFDLILITDISVNEEVAEKLDLVHKGNIAKVQLLDHHITAKSLNKYEWAHVEEKDSKGLTSGTSLLFGYLDWYYRFHVNHETFNQLENFVEKVRRYDTWEWFNIFNDEHAKRLNNLLYLIGTNKFLTRFVSNPSPYFNDGEILLLDVEDEKSKAYIEKKTKEVQIHKLFQYDVAVVYADQYVSELGNHIARNVGCDLVVIIDIARGKVSYRTKYDDVDVSKVAQAFGGGGHAKASGSNFEHKVDEIKAMIFNNVFYNEEDGDYIV